jgi:4-coumarate--CoA ligase
MVFKSPYPLTLPNIDYLNYLFSSTIFKSHDKVWIEATTPSNSITQARALELTQRIGAGLQSLGVNRPQSTTEERHIILLCSENQVMTPVTMFGIINAGGVVCTCPPQASSMEIARQIASCRPKVVICSPGILETAREGVKGSVLKDIPIAVMSSADGKQELTLLDGTSLISDKKLELEKISDPNVLSKRVCFLGYSSGTTGVPKGRGRESIDERYPPSPPPRV